MSMNPLHTFTGNLTGLLPSLSLLDATGIVDWKPEKRLFQLRMLQRIIGLSWSAECKNCLFYRTNTTFSTEPMFSESQKCYVFVYRITNVSPIAHVLSNISFQIRCKNTYKCIFSKQFTTLIKTTNNCWKETLIGINFQSVLGVLGVFLNLVVFVNILISKNLRNNISMLFVCNMAVSDFLLSVYTICITAYLNSVSFAYMNNNSDRQCWKMGFLWMLGETASVITAFFLTLERYLVIVYSLQPDIRVTRKMAMIMVLICWLVAVFLTGYALYYNFYKFTFVCIPVRFDIFHFHVFIFTVAIVGSALTLFLITFIFYVHIYITVKRTAQNAGVKRESKLAKRIALLVFSNVFFFCFPIVLAGIVWGFAYFRIFPDLSDVAFEMIAKVIPAVCLSLNSFLNPFLHAFRNDRFTQALKERLQYLRHHIRSVLPHGQWNFRVGP